MDKGHYKQRRRRTIFIILSIGSRVSLNVDIIRVNIVKVDRCKYTCFKFALPDTPFLAMGVYDSNSNLSYSYKLDYIFILKSH